MDKVFHMNWENKRRRGLNALLHEAERAVKAEDAELWLENLD